MNNRMDSSLPHPSGAVTPPATTVAQEERLPSILTLEVGGNSQPPTAQPLADTAPATQLSALSPPALIEFPFSAVDYEIDRAKFLGSGLWSDVYLAHPKSSIASPSDILTPPTTPVKGTFSTCDSALKAQLYAIKLPLQRMAHSVLRYEAHILSYLTTLAHSGNHIVPFLGYDVRNEGLVMEAVPQTLERYVVEELGGQGEASRAKTLAHTFPHLALHLVEGLAWLHGAGVVHGDVKPANILLKPLIPNAVACVSLPISDSSPNYIPFIPLYADFSASIRLLPPSSPTSRSDKHSSSPPSLPVGGGTWDFMAPELLFSTNPPPTRASDVYALGITLLYATIGDSPFSGAANAFIKREMVKAGDAMGFALADARNEERFEGLERRLLTAEGEGLDLSAFLKMGLARKAEERFEAAEWAEWLESRMACM